MPYVESEFRGGFLYLNKEMTPELEAEGFSREIMRRVQSLRKKSGLEKKDKVELFIKADKDLVSRLKKFEEAIAEKVGASSLVISESGATKKFSNSSKEKVKGEGFELFLSKI